MSTQVVKPGTITDLTGFVSRLKRASNLGFDSTTREPTVYTDAKRTTVAKAFPWKREVDALTVLTSPGAYSQKAIDAALSRVAATRAEVQEAQRTALADMQVAEGRVLDAWRTYNAATNADKPALRRTVLMEEAALMELERAAAPKTRYGRKFEFVEGVGAYVPPMALDRRGIPIGSQE